MNARAKPHVYLGGIYSPSQVIYEQLEEEGIDIEEERLTIIAQHLTPCATSTTRSFHRLRMDSIRVTECECHLNV